MTLGFICCLAVVLIVRRMGILDTESQPVLIPLKLLRYIPWLVWQIAKANIQVARIILHPRLPISPTIFKLKTGQQTDLGCAIYANSITLTPGTVSISVDPTTIEIHALTEAFATNVQQGKIERQVARTDWGT